MLAIQNRLESVYCIPFGTAHRTRPGVLYNSYNNSSSHTTGHQVVQGSRLSVYSTCQAGGDWSDTLCQLVANCTQLKTLIVDAVLSDDQFLACLCQHALRLCHLSITVGPRVTRDVLEAVFKTLPSLSALWIGVSRDSPCPIEGELDERYLTGVVSQYHGAPCYCNTWRLTKYDTVYQLAFSPLKFLTAGSLAAEL